MRSGLFLDSTSQHMHMCMNSSSVHGVPCRLFPERGRAGTTARADVVEEDLAFPVRVLRPPSAGPKGNGIIVMRARLPTWGLPRAGPPGGVGSERRLM